MRSHAWHDAFLHATPILYPLPSTARNAGPGRCPVRRDSHPQTVQNHAWVPDTAYVLSNAVVASVPLRWPPEYPVVRLSV